MSQVSASVADWQGSIIVVEASSKEEIMEVLKRDVYYHNGVWDLDKAQITPLMIAILNP